MCARRCACCLTFFVRVPLSACGSGSPALCGSRLAPSAILLFLWILWPLSLFLSLSPAPLGPGLYILYPHFVSRDREIPIHALRMEGDTCIISLKTGAVNISIHVLRVEGDLRRIREQPLRRNFYPPMMALSLPSNSVIILFLFLLIQYGCTVRTSGCPDINFRITEWTFLCCRFRLFFLHTC